ncbi:hypothetical protein BDFB_006579 [Asbolus verrucosus]|uniref:Uncharacterized protein n=1 Tax=Asbolus verrucosus TaxID=1661398 RepID=A0A482W665_ASBVE|nr:hypothetical protein BDFB_006579 [Asbolus verrucosus]
MKLEQVDSAEEEGAATPSPDIALRMTLDVAIRKQKLKVEYIRKEIEMKQRLHQLKMEMLRKELEYKKLMLELLKEEL